jgi:hypothetical protein
MFCERCESRGATPEWPGGMTPSVARVWGGHRLEDLLCSACGVILTAEGFAERLLRKHLQLARFGLVSAAGPLLEATNGDVD